MKAARKSILAAHKYSKAKPVLGITRTLFKSKRICNFLAQA
jgi:hypothetical protein